MPGKTNARVKDARQKEESERVESSSALFARVDAVEAIEKRQRFGKLSLLSPHSNDSIPHLLDSLEEAPEAHPRIECPVVERAAAGAARIRSEEVGTRSCVSSPRETKVVER